MKELLKYSKNLEVDFQNPNPAYQSKIDLAVTSLVMGDYEKSKQMFDSAIELDSLFPSAWIGKAFVEIARVDDSEFNNLEIDEYIKRALKSNLDLTPYKVALTGCLAYRHAELIKKHVYAVEELIEAQKKAKKTAVTGLAVAAAGTMFTGKNKSLQSNIVGGALIGGGVVTSLNAGIKAVEIEKIGNSIYNGALSQTYLSIPIIRLSETLIEVNIDSQLKNAFNKVVSSWKESVIYLFEKEKEQLVNKLKKQNFVNAQSVEELLKDPNSIQEVGEFVAFLNLIGLSNHKVSDIVSKLFKETLPSFFNDSDAMEGLKKAKKGQNVGIAILLICLCVGLCFLLMGNDAFSYAFDGGGILIAVLLMGIFRSKEMKEFEQSFKETISEIQAIKIYESDFNLSILNEENNTDSYNSLGTK